MSDHIPPCDVDTNGGDCGCAGKWKDAALAWREMNGCLRVGKQPTEALFARCEKAAEYVRRSRDE